MQSSLDQLHRLVRDRETLRPRFQQVWSFLQVVDAALIEPFAHATMELVRVNAGAACIETFWRAAETSGPDCLRQVIGGGHAVADICRHAGARAALACLEAMPVAMRMTAADPGELGFFWNGLVRLSREAPSAVRDTAGRMERMLAGGGRGFADFVAFGLKATTRDARRRAAFFTLDDPQAHALLSRMGAGQGFADAERMLEAFVTGLWSVAPRLQAGPSSRRTIIASGLVLLPPVFAGVPPDRSRALYRAAVAHAQSHLMIPALRQAIGSLRPLQVALVGLVEDARVETLAIRRFPGLRRLWAEFHQAQPSGAVTATGLMARLARALLDPDWQDPNGFVAKGRALFAAADPEDPAISRQIGGLLGNDLGQMRVQFNARTYVVEPVYRDDNMHLWDIPDAPDELLSLTIDAARGVDDPGGDTLPGDGALAPRAHEAGADDQATLLATYPEWDAAAGVERPDWTSLRDTIPRLANTPTTWPGEAALRARIARLVRGTVVGRSVRQPAREDGEELDIDAAIKASVARRSDMLPDMRVYRDRRPIERDLATLIIMDVSQSTGAVGPAGLSVLAAQRLAVEALAAALEARGDRYALRAFASVGRHDVRLSRLKDFDEPLSPVVSARLAGLSAGLSTRLGAALRHAGAELKPLRTSRKLVLVLTDGEPSDIDVADPAELVEDARRAVRGLRGQGIDVFGIVMDPQNAGSGSAIFGRHNAISVTRLEDLPGRLAGVYFRLTLR